ncbi:DedA family protein [Craterilacuibacter sp. RT1T]|uniref:YqaA family protein n=1 Tax=Craterilacuibacter sp. RT1T TaxID=2942211 RepID=UPI0032DF3315
MDAVWLGLGGLALSAFLSATVLPGNSELALGAFLYQWPSWWLAALLLATLANSLGSASSLYLGRLAPRKELTGRALSALQRFGPAALLLSWVPVLGDALPLAAGWLRLPVLPCLVWIVLGKCLRYAMLVLAIKAWL